MDNPVMLEALIAGSLPMISREGFEPPAWALKHKPKDPDVMIPAPISSELPDEDESYHAIRAAEDYFWETDDRVGCRKRLELHSQVFLIEPKAGSPANAEELTKRIVMRAGEIRAARDVLGRHRSLVSAWEEAAIRCMIARQIMKLTGLS